MQHTPPRMSEKKECPSYPVRGLIISGDPIPTAATPGCGESNATGVRTSQVVAPGLTTPRASGATTTTTASSRPKLAACKPKPPTKPSGVGKGPSGEVPLPVVASTSAAAKAALADSKSAQSLSSGDNKVSQVPCANVESSTLMSDSSAAPPPTLEKSSNSLSGSSNVSLESSPRHKTPSRRAFVHRRAAERIVERHGAKPNDALTRDEKSSLDWAKSLLARLKGSDPPAEAEVVRPAAEAPKRQRSEEETLTSMPNDQPTKRQKQAQTIVINRPFSEVARNPLVRAIVDQSNSDGAISQEKWGTIRQKMLGVYWKILKENPGPAPQNDYAGWYQGHIKLLACSNERSALLLKLAIQSLGEVWPGARLDVIPVSEIPRRPRSIATIPTEPHDPAEILAFLQSGNPHLPTHDWKVVKVSAPMGNVRKATVVLNKETLAPLRECGGKVYYGFDSISLRIYRSDAKRSAAASGTKPEAPSKEDNGKADDPAGSENQEDSQSTTGIMGELLGNLKLAEDGDSSQDSDPEDVDVTVVYDPDLGDGEGNPD
ncbi:uncharacterized protein LOC119612468 [Lucilia sericata]|uniref:uncharacterized protein LOC119612468 n=2 Tax=Lucilia sericata TaxID=13632 RepID=UPI0018A8448F|nr:uncharacterized protein LOC119612468 [Lucilia sericata]XP_037824204.1 uncharacterized protein LOC119612468 [Lucilia sericata]XP_037824205.1 uncharacterized protein LOC119612468 [Lucilia sericata]